MATPKRPAKPGISWTFNELDAYNIHINTVDTQAFFGISNLPEPAVDPVILQNVDLPRDLTLELPYDLRFFFVYLRDSTDKDQPSFVDDFTHHLLGSLLRFGDGLARRRTTFPFIMSGRRVKAIANVSVRRGDYQVMLVQRDRVSLPLFPCCRASLNTDKDISRSSRASASGLCSRGIFRGQRQAHCKGAGCNTFPKVHWDCHDWVGTLFLQDHHHTSPR